MTAGPDKTLTVLERPHPPVTARRRAWTAAVVLVVLAIYLTGLSPHWYLGKDTGLYMNLARNMVRGEGYTIAGRPHVGVPPGLPWLLAAVIAVFGESFLAINALMCLMGLAAALLTYLLLRELVHRDWALLMTAVLALSREMVDNSGEVLSDLPFMMVLTAALWLYARGLRSHGADRRGWELASVLLVGSLGFRAAGLPAVVAAPIGLVLSAGKAGRRRALLNAALVGVLLGGLCLAFVAYYRANADDRTMSYPEALSTGHRGFSALAWAGRILRSVYDGSAKFSRLITAQSMPRPVSMIVLVAPVLIGMVRRIRRGDRLGPVVTIGYVGALCLLGLETRYLYPLLPLLALYLIEGWLWIVALLVRGRAAGAAAASGMLIAMLALNLPVTVRNVCRKHLPDYWVMQQHGKWKDHIDAAEFLKARKAPGEALIGLQTVGYLADMPCPTFSMQVLLRAHSPEELWERMRERKVRYVVVDVDEQARPFLSSLRAYLTAAATPVFQQGVVRVYAIDEAGRPVAGRAAESAPSGS